MKPLIAKPFVVAGLAVLLSACGAGRRAPAAAPTPAPAPAPVPPTATKPEPPASPLTEAPANWQLLDDSLDRVPGTSAERAYRELLAGRQPRRTVVVAVIDDGVDTSQVDLRANLWSNPRETPGNARDDDNNGYVDDVHGWDFIGGRDGRDVGPDTYELTREHARCIGQPGLPRDTLTRTPAQCQAIAADYEKQRANAQQLLTQYQSISSTIDRVMQLLRPALHDSVTPSRVAALQSADPDVMRARDAYMRLASNGITPAIIAEGLAQLTTQVKYNLNPAWNPRPIVGDDYPNVAERRYGNNDVTGPDALHGTHVAGIIGAIRGNGVGIDGIAPAVRIMSVRVVPDGDERDKDVANGIRYAVDNGANVINMSFGKAYSPYKGAVDDAVRYADAHGVLMVHAAGNEGTDLGTGRNFPTAFYLGGGRAQNWIEVGASSWRMDSLAASFSNYGRGQVDLFAPGVDILSLVPGNTTQRESGTSMASPVVTGVAALVMAYYPELTASDIKRVLLTSARTRFAGTLVTRPGGDDRVAFGSLSATGGIVNAYDALRLAATVAAGKKAATP